MASWAILALSLAAAHAERVQAAAFLQREAPLGPPAPKGGASAAQLASTFVLTGVEAALQATGVQHIGPVHGKLLHGAELEAMRLALDQLRGGDPTCVLAGDLMYTDLLNRTAETVLRDGLPPWRATPAPSPTPPGEGPRIAYLVQLSRKSQLPLVNRTYHRLYDTRDTFLYVVDVGREGLTTGEVERALGPVPANVRVREAKHAGFFFWPRVQVALAGVQQLLQQDRGWNVLVHLSESGYPLHRKEWMRRALATHPGTSFVEAVPYCEDAPKPKPSRKPSLARRLVRVHAPAPAPAGGGPKWWFWGKTQPVASCGTTASPVEHAPVGFPLSAMSRRGFRFAHGEEWNVLTRDLCEYATQPALVDFKRLMSMRWGADEMFWSTLVSNIPNFTQLAQPASMWFKRWQGHGSSPHSPDLLQWPHHTPELFAAAPRAFFARKLQLPESQTTVDMLDAQADNETLPLTGPVGFHPPEHATLDC